jgi:hypothetical protein
VREVRCLCGKVLKLSRIQPPPDICPGCNRPFIDAEEEFRRKSGGPQPYKKPWDPYDLPLGLVIKGGLLVVALVVLGPVYLYKYLTSPPPADPPQTEPPTRQFPQTPSGIPSLWAEYSRREPPPVDPAADRPAIAYVLERLREAQELGDGPKYVARLNVRRMVAESERLGSSKPFTTLESQRRIIRSIEAGFQTDLGLLQISPISARWSRLEVRKIDFLPARGEAVAACWLTAHGDRRPWRFWLIKEPDGWRVFDFLDVDDGLRTAAGIRDTRSFEFVSAGYTLQDASNLIKQGKPAEALQTLKAARQVNDPQRLSPAIDLVQTEALIKMGKTVEAMDLLEQLSETYNDRPMIHRRRAVLLRAMGKDAESAAAAAEYKRLLDADIDKDYTGK